MFTDVPFEELVEAIFSKPGQPFNLESLRLPEWPTPYSLPSRLVDEFKRTKDEQGYYRPFTGMMTQAVLDYIAAMKEIEGPDSLNIQFPCGVFFDGIRGDDQYDQVGEKRKLDSACGLDDLHAVYQAVRWKNLGIRDSSREKSDQPKLTWDPVLAWFEYVRKRSWHRQLLKDLDEGKHHLTPASSCPQTPNSSKRKADYQSSEGSKRMKLASFSEESTTVTYSATSTQTLTVTDPAHISPAVPPGLKDFQGAEYAAETLGTGRRCHSLGVRVTSNMVTLWYFDRMGAIASKPFDFLVEKELLLLLSVALARADLDQYGFEPIIVPRAVSKLEPRDLEPHDGFQWSDPPGEEEQDRFASLRAHYIAQKPPLLNPILDWSKDHILRIRCDPDVPNTVLSTAATVPESTTASPSPYTPDQTPSASVQSDARIREFFIDGAPLYSQPGTIGRGTLVLPISSAPGEEDLVAKASWQPIKRLNEALILRVIESKIPPKWMQHLPDLKYSATRTKAEKELPRVRVVEVMLSRIERSKQKEQDGENMSQEIIEALDQRRDAIRKAFDTFEERELRVLIVSRYLPLNKVKNAKQFLKVFRDTVQAHYVVFVKADILHRDLSVNNIMFVIDSDGSYRGILNDWDLAAPLKKIRATSTHRTGTAAYMAYELLVKSPEEPLRHAYHHDLESFAWILIWCAFVLKGDGEEVDWNEQPERIRCWTSPLPWTDIADKKMGSLHNLNYLNDITTMMRVTREVLIRPLMRKLRSALSAQVAKYYRTVLSTRKPPTQEVDDLGLDTSSSIIQETIPEIPESDDPLTFFGFMRLISSKSKTPKEDVETRYEGWDNEVDALAWGEEWEGEYL